MNRDVTYEKLKEMKKNYEWDFYVGDPCYVIDDDRWGDFCDLLFKHRNYDGVSIEWTQRDEDGKLHTDTVEVWSSPFGDGCWDFDNTVKGMAGWVAGTELGVDAGLIAVVPKEMVHKDHIDDVENLGILFTCYPELETGEHLGGYVHLNGEHPDGYYECDCGEITDDGQMWWCDNCGSSACDSCGGNCYCEKCERCGCWFDGSYEDKCEDCIYEEEEE